MKRKKLINKIIKKIFMLMAVVSLSFSIISCDNKDTEKKKKMYIHNYELNEKGFLGIEEVIRQDIKMPDILCINHFDAEISEKGIVKKFNLTLSAFNSGKEYMESYNFTYDNKNNKIQYNKEASMVQSSLPSTYNLNNELKYLDKKLKEIPFEKQIEKLNFKRYVVKYDVSSKSEEGKPIIEEKVNSEFPVMTLEQYKAGVGGISDGKTSVIFTLYDGVSITSDNLINYKCIPADNSTLQGDRNNIMQCDYYINNNELKFTQDWGETWIKSGISKENLQKTMMFYKLSGEIPDGSFYISKEKDGIIACFHDDLPTLNISRDNGETWTDISFTEEFPREVNRRIVGFTSKTDGYVALGTDWSMGTGEGKYCYFTRDGGSTWHKKELPNNGTSSTLADMCFMDSNKGIVSLNANSNGSEYKFFCTEDGAKSWKEIEIPYEKLSEEIGTITKIDSLEYDNNTYRLTMGQGYNENMKVIFESKDLKQGWKFVKSYKDVIHYKG